MPLSDLYLNIWQNIVPYVTTRDLLSLRLSNKAINEIISSDVIWSNIVNNRWFSIDDVPKDQYSQIKHNYLNYYISRSKKDYEFLNLLNNMKTSNNQTFVFEKAFEIIGETSYEYIPILFKLRRCNDDLRMKFLSTNILNSLRRKQCLEFLNNGFDSNDVEGFFFQLSYLDPAFDELLPYRNLILSKVVLKVKALMNLKDSSTFKVDLILKIFFEVCKCSNNYELIQGGFSSTVSEEYSILRVYSGEVMGHLWLRYSIIQKIASFFKIKCDVTKTFLIIYDSTLEDGVSLLFLKGDKPQFMNLRYFVSLLPFDRHIQDQTSPLTSNDILSFTSNNNQFNSLSAKMIIENDALEPFLKLFPRSKVPFHYRIFDILLLYREFKPNIKTHTVELYPFDSQIQEYPFDLGIYFKLFKNFNYPLPADLFYLPQESRYILCDSTEIDVNLPKSEFQTGQIVFHPRYKSFGVILCPIYEERLDIQSGEYMITYNILTMKSFGSVWLQPESINEVNQDLLNFIMEFPLIGKYFDSFDKSTNLFKPNKITRDKLHKKLMINYFHED